MSDFRLNYRGPFIPSYSDALDNLIKGVEYGNEQKRARRKDDEYKRQNDLVEQRLKAQDERERLKFDTEMGDRDAGTLDEIVKRYAEGDVGAAEGYAATKQFYDPRSRTTRGIDFQRRRLPGKMDAPQLKPPGELGDNAGNPTTPPLGEMRLKPPMEEAPDAPAPGLYGMLNPTPTAKPPGLAGMLKPPEKLETGSDTPDVDAARGPEVGVVRLPNGREITLDPGARDAYKARQASAQRERLQKLLDDPSIDPRVKSAIALNAGLTGSQASGAERAAVNNTATQVAGQDFKTGEADKHDMTADQKYAIGMRPRGGGGGRGAKKDDLTITKKQLDIEQEYMDAAEKTLGKTGYVDVVKNARKVEDMAAQVAGADHSSALASIVAGSFTKYAQGGTGVISDADLRFFWQKLGGIAQRWGQSIENVLSGKLTPEIKAEVETAMKTLASSSQQHQDEFGPLLVANVGQLPGGSERLPRVLQTYAPHYYEHVYLPQRAKTGDNGAVGQINDWARNVVKGMR